MPDIRIHREHDLGLANARRVAWQWAVQVERDFELQCTVIEGKTSDTIEFTRSGVSGTLIVAADHFDLHAKLGFLLGVFSLKIESEIERTLDDLLGKAGKRAPKPAAKAARHSLPKPAAKGAGRKKG
jgi:putative polyhydroxyalkanoate system protein